MFSDCRKKPGSESKLKSKRNNNHYQPWKYSILHRLKKKGSPGCPSKHGIQIVDLEISQNKGLKNEREILKGVYLKQANGR